MVKSKKTSTKTVRPLKKKDIEFLPLSEVAMKRYQQKLLRPSPEVRALDMRNLVGKTLSITLGHTDDRKENQYVSIEGTLLERHVGIRLHMSGWIGRNLGAQGSTQKHKVAKAYLVGHQNGGRQQKSAYTYGEFFNSDQKRLVEAMRRGGVESRILGGMFDYDRADVRVEFETPGLALESHPWELEAPEEWYSEMHQDYDGFKFQEGFFDSPEEAIEFYSKAAQDDLFGTRYFPVLVFPYKVKHEALAEILYRPKAVSKPILLSDRLVYGARCKPHEYAEVIALTYAEGGRVAKGLQWDW